MRTKEHKHSLMSKSWNTFKHNLSHVYLKVRRSFQLKAAGRPCLWTSSFFSLRFVNVNFDVVRVFCEWLLEEDLGPVDKEYITFKNRKPNREINLNEQVNDWWFYAVSASKTIFMVRTIIQRIQSSPFVASYGTVKGCWRPSLPLLECWEW